MLSLTWLVPSVRKPPPEITKKPHRRGSSMQPRELPLLLTGVYEKAEHVPRPVRSLATESAPSSPCGRPIPLAHCESRSVRSEVVSHLPASAPVTPDNSPLSSAETLTEAPTETKRVFSTRFTRMLAWSRSSSIGATSTSSSTAIVSEFGEQIVAGEKRDTRPPRGKFGFLNKSRAIDIRTRGGESRCLY